MAPVLRFIRHRRASPAKSKADEIRLDYNSLIRGIMQEWNKESVAFVLLTGMELANIIMDASDYI